MLNQSVGILAHLEEVSLLLGRLNLSATVRTLAVHELALCPEALTGSTVHTLIGSLVDISLVIQPLKYLLNLLLMIIICGSDKFVIAYVQAVADTLNGSSHAVHELLGRNTCSLGLLFYLLTMLISSCLEEHIIALLSLMSCNRICHHDLIGITDMRFARSVCYCCC